MAIIEQSFYQMETGTIREIETLITETKNTNGSRQFNERRKSYLALCRNAS